MNRLLFADTPVQVVNCVLLATSFVKEADDLYLIVYCQFSNWALFVDWAKDTKAFTRVVTIPATASSNGLIYKLRFFSVLMGCRYLDLETYATASMRKRIDCFFCSCPTPVTQEILILLRKANPELGVYFYEDGCGTYTGNVFRGMLFTGEVPEGVLCNRNISKLAKTFVNRIASENGQYKVRGLFVKQPHALLYTPDWPVYEMPLVSSLDTASLSRLSQTTIPPGSIIVFDAVHGKSTEGLDHVTERLIIQLASQYNRVFVKRHPRDMDNSNPPCSVELLGGDQWEAVCCRNDLSSCLLVGLGSSALLSPAIETQAYPTIIDLSDVLSGNARSGLSKENAFTSVAKQLYGARSTKIKAPRSEQEAWNEAAAFISLSRQGSAMESSVSESNFG